MKMKEGHTMNPVKSLAQAVENLQMHLEKGAPENLSLIFERMVALFDENGEYLASKVARDYAHVFHNTVKIQILDKYDLEDECPECDLSDDDGFGDEEIDTKDENE
jgi:hypothetical protein